MNIYQTKKKYSNSNENRCFSEEKLIKQFGPPPFQREPLLSTNSPISEPNFKNKKPHNFRGKETMKALAKLGKMFFILFQKLFLFSRKSILEF